MDVDEALKEIGLNWVESRVYLATLELGSSTVLPISKKSGVKRTYCYDLLADLMKRGLVSFAPHNGRRQYSAEDPKRIEEMLQAKISRFSEALPQLRSIYNNTVEKPAIRFYEGKEEVKNIYELFPKAKSIDFIAFPDFLYEYLGDYFADLSERVHKNKVKVREIVPFKNKDAAYIQDFDQELQEVRFLPKEANLATDIAILDDKLALVSYAKEIHGVLIESKSIVDTHRYMFDLIWEMSSKVHPPA